jgi:hypothetical protein
MAVMNSHDEPSVMERAVEAVQSKAMSLRRAASAFTVSKSALQRRTSGQVAINAPPGPIPILTAGEVQGVLDSVDERTTRGQCFTTPRPDSFLS